MLKTKLAGNVYDQFGARALPNRVYLIDIGSRIVYKSMWTRPLELREFLTELVETSAKPARQGL